MLNKWCKASPKKSGHLLGIQNPTQEKEIVSITASGFEIHTIKIWNCNFYFHLMYLLQKKLCTYYVWNAKEVVSKSYTTERIFKYMKH